MAYFTIGRLATGPKFGFSHGTKKNEKGEGGAATRLDFEEGKHTRVNDPVQIDACRRYAQGGYLVETDGKGDAPVPKERIDDEAAED